MQNRFRIEYRIYTDNNANAFVTAPDDEIGDGINALTLSFEHNGYQHYNTAATSSFEIRGNFYEVVYTQLWLSQTAQSNSIELRIYDNVCGKYFNGFYYIKPAGISFCSECTLKVQAKYEDRALECFKITLIDTDQSTNPDAAHDWFSGGMQHPTFPYCKNKGWLYPLGAMFIFAVIIIPILGLLLLWIANQWFQRIYEQARGCERKNPSPYIRTYIQNMLDNCNTILLADFVFHSPTFLPDLYNACIYYMPNKRGVYYTDNTLLYRRENSLNWSGERFMAFLQKRFNLKWRINPNANISGYGGLLIHNFVEPYSNTPLLDLRTVDKCCTWTGDKAFAYGDYDFQQDAMDSEGNAARRAYNDIVEFNDPYSPSQSGGKVIKFDDAAVGFRNDGLRSDDISQWDNILSFIPFTIVANVLVPLQNADDFVLMSGDNTQHPKVIIHDITTPLTSAKAIKKQWSAAEVAVLTAEGYSASSFYSQFGKTTYFYNYVAPANWELNPITENTATLFECDNIRLCECRRNISCKYVVPNCDCKLLETLGIYEGTTTGAIIDYPVIMDNNFIGELRAIDIDFGNDTITLTAIPVGCIEEEGDPVLVCSIEIDEVIIGECFAGMAEISVLFTATNVDNVIVEVGGITTVVSAADGIATISVPATGTSVAVSVTSTIDEDCNIGATIELPDACVACAIIDLLATQTNCEEACDCNNIWLHDPNIEEVIDTDFIGVTVNGTTYNAPVPIAYTDEATIRAFLFGLNLPVNWIVHWFYDSIPDHTRIFANACQSYEIVILTDAGNFTLNSFQNPDIPVTFSLFEYYENEWIGAPYVFECYNNACNCGNISCPCNPDGTVSVTVTWSAFNTSGLVTVSVGATTATGISANGGTHTMNVPADGTTVTVRVEDASDPECFQEIEYELPLCEAECHIEITDVSVITCEEDAYQVWQLIIQKTDILEVNSMTINGTTYTPGAPILATDIAGLNAYFDSVSDDFVVFQSFASYISVVVITDCGTTISGATIDYTEPDLDPATGVLNDSTGIVTCADVQLMFPAFICDNGCNISGEVGLSISWTGYGTSGVVIVDAGGLGSIIVPMVFGSVVLSIPANGETIDVTVCDANDPTCCGTFEITLPDCTP